MMLTLQDLNGSQSANLAIKVRFLLVYLCLCFGQFLIGQDYNDINVVYYKMIGDIISKDTLVSDITSKTLSNGIQTGKYTKSDSLQIVRNTKDRELKLFRYSSNEGLKSELNHQIGRENSSLTGYLGKEAIIKAIKSIPDKIEHNRSLLDNRVVFFDKIKTTTLGHFFSSPIRIEPDLFLCYHVDKNNSIEADRYLILFRIDKLGGYAIEKKYNLSFSVR